MSSGPKTDAGGERIAIIGMACRFPKAPTLEAFWNNLRQGVEGLTRFTDADLEAAGVDPALRSHPDYVRAGFALDGIDLFDAAFFGLSPREAEVLDPQHRLFLECAWEALERAGHDPDAYPGAISLFAGVGANSYLVSNLLSRPELNRSVGGYQVMLGNDKDFLATRVSYKLNLRGPSLSVQTACSSSLVAVHLACQSLLNGESDMALAGGVSIVPNRAGYLYQEGGILSPDGHCRAFDETAQGTVGGSGAGIVVLKRLADAVHDGNFIHAVILGSAVNNDGAAKVGYTAPGVEGQAAVISEALAVAGVEPESLSYVEAHGTGTPLGDPIEVSALNQVFSANVLAPNTCALGSVKTNIGHLDTASGIAGLIKTALAIEHRQLPPSLHFQRATPKLGLDKGPFYVNSVLRDWRTNAGPLRAGVSSFGIGGTNAHVILEEAPRPELKASSGSWHLVALSARTAPALEAATDNLVAHLEQNPSVNLADVAHTLQVGRRRFPHRRVLVCRDADDALRALRARDPERVATLTRDLSGCSTVFMFPGQGAQYPGMGHGLYLEEPTFRQHLDLCCDLLKPHLGFDLREVLFPPAPRAEAAGQRLMQTSVAQPALFAIEYSAARMWMAFGVVPHAMIGHSIGEYVAACLADVFSLEDALSLVVARGRMMQELPGGSMLSVALSEQGVQPLLGEELSLAAVNGPTLCVLSGPTPAVEALQARLAQQGVKTQWLHTSHAFHSKMVDPVLDAFTEAVGRVRLSPPRVPYVSNLSGRWITAAEATSPRYWADHLRGTVRFNQGLDTLLEEPGNALLEVGPGNALTTLVTQRMKPPATVTAVPTLRHAQNTQPDWAFLLSTVGRLWLAGVDFDWPKLHSAQHHRRIPLPPYPFQRERYWIEPRRTAPEPPAAGPARKRSDPTDWFYAPAWRVAPRTPAAPGPMRRARWLVLADGAGIGQRLAQRLEEEGGEVAVVVAGPAFSKQGGRRYELDPGQPAHYPLLLSELKALGWSPERILHLWSLDSPAGFDAQQARGFYSLLFLVQALQEPSATEGAIQVDVVTRGAQDVTGDEPLHPGNATVLGPCKVIPQEHPGIRCRNIDVVLPEAGGPGEGRLIDHLLAELGAEIRHPAVALRGERRWVESFEPVRLPAPSERVELREGGVYVITGGLGRIGLATAEYLARTARARLVLVGRSPLPARPEWDAWLKTHGEEESARKLRRLLALEQAGAEVLVLSADVSQPAQLEGVLAQAQARFGALHGVFHAAGSLGPQTLFPARKADRPRCEEQFQAKVRGLLALARALQGRRLDFVVLQSSLAAILGGIGFSAYAAANAFMDLFAAQQGRVEATPWISVDWDGWSAGEAGPEGASGFAMTFEEGIAALRRILATRAPGRWAVSTGDLSARLATWIQPAPAAAPPAAEVQDSSPGHRRPELTTPFVGPRDEVERTIAAIWEELLGIRGLGIHDNFFELGGHSLLGTQVMSRIQEALKADLPLRTLFEKLTISGLALAVVQSRAAAVDPGALEAILAELERGTGG